IVIGALAASWEPVGPERGLAGNAFFICVIVGSLLALFWLLRISFPRVLAWTLRHKVVSLVPAVFVVLLGASAWLGFERVWGWLPDSVRERSGTVELAHAFPGLGNEFMP